MATYLPRFRKMVDALRKNKLLSVGTFKVAKPSKRVAEIAKREKLAPAMLSFWSEANGLELEWKAKDGEGSGRIEILPIEKIFGDWEDVIWFDFTEPDDDFRKLRPVDFFQPEACAALLLDGTKKPKVVYHYCGEEIGAMNVDLPGYLELLLKTRGFHYWQTAIVADITGEESTTSPAEFRDRMPELFPDFKLSDVLKRKVAKKDAKRRSEYETSRAKVVDALEAAGAAFVLRNPKARTGYISIDLTDLSPANAKKVEAGLVAGHLPDWKGFAKQITKQDFGAQSIGGVMVAKA